MHVTKKTKESVLKALKQSTGHDMGDCFKGVKMIKSSKNPIIKAKLMGFRSLYNPYSINESFISFGITHGGKVQKILMDFMKLNKDDVLKKFNTVLKRDLENNV